VWRDANVTPIHKSGSKLLAANSRPISLTCLPCKVMEGVIREVILGHCRRHGLFSKQQHGFVPGKSCTTNLLETFDILTAAMQDGLPVDIIFTDFAKAFDVVPHRRLLHKLRGYSISGKLLAWIAA
jgi:hypothetical protein